MTFPNSNAALRWLVIGDTASPHFLEIAEALNQDACIKVRRISEAESLLVSAECVPDAVLVYQGIPHEYPRIDAERLIGLLPLARWIVCFSAWCESQGRSEQLWPHGWCVPAKDVLPRIARLRRAHALDEPILPATASRDEAFARLAADFATARAQQPLRFAVRGVDRAFIELARDMLREFGHIPTKSVPDAELLVLVVGVPEPSSFEEVQSLVSQHADLRVMVVTDLATPSDIERFRAAGAFDVVSTLRFSEGRWTTET